MAYWLGTYKGSYVNLDTMQFLFIKYEVDQFHVYAEAKDQLITLQIFRTKEEATSYLDGAMDDWDEWAKNVGKNKP